MPTYIIHVAMPARPHNPQRDRYPFGSNRTQQGAVRVGVTTLTSALPVLGTRIVGWLWGGFCVDNPSNPVWAGMPQRRLHRTALPDCGKPKPMNVATKSASKPTRTHACKHACTHTWSRQGCHSSHHIHWGCLAAAHQTRDTPPLRLHSPPPTRPLPYTDTRTWSRQGCRQMPPHPLGLPGCGT
jgi:hypothetical protein